MLSFFRAVQGDSCRRVGGSARDADGLVAFRQEVLAAIIPKTRSGGGGGGVDGLVRRGFGGLEPVLARNWDATERHRYYDDDNEEEDDGDDGDGDGGDDGEDEDEDTDED